VANRLAQFVIEQTFQVPGLKCSYGRFCDSFLSWLSESERPDWTKPQIGKMLDALGIDRGVGSNGRWFVGNIDLKADRPTLRRSGDRLIRVL
jgi:hypothetical protein